ncbi:50S ribosomal protein L33 [Salibacterium salarium]|uniref:Large ribosomal subunit protein bL33 n=1 Tax=Salibacterium salarium TaxID=284579 RepID=A0A428MUD0_9BACI|nr:ribosomal protein L33 [Salibacterium salarium]
MRIANETIYNDNKKLRTDRIEMMKFCKHCNA